MATIRHNSDWNRPLRTASVLLGVSCSAFIALPAVGQVAADAGADSVIAAPADSTTPPTADQIAEWIGQLGHDSYAVRQAAAEHLLAGGHAARGALLEVVDAPDPEIRSAARRLVTLIEQSEFDRRLAEFAADVDGQRGVTLPGWAEFSGLVGGDESARALFVDMQRCEAALLAAIFAEGGDEPDRDWEERLFRLHNWQATSGQRSAAPPLGSCATMLLLGSLPDRGGSERGAIGIAELAQRPPIREAILGDATPQNSIIRRLLLTWVTDCPVRHDQVLHGRLNLISTYKLAEALPLAVSVARGEPPFLTAAAHNRVMAILAVGRFGSRAQVDDLEPLLEDDTLWAMAGQPGQPGNPRAVQVRDVALATMLHLTGQRHSDYGFVGVQRNPQLLFNPQTLGLTDDVARAAAATKWREWRAANERAGDSQ